MIGRLVSFWEGLFSDAMLDSGRVCQVMPSLVARAKHFYWFALVVFQVELGTLPETNIA